MYSCTHVLMYVCTHVLITHVLTYSCIYVLMYLCTMYSRTHVPMYSFTHILIYILFYILIYSCTHVLMYSFTHVLTNNNQHISHQQLSRPHVYKIKDALKAYEAFIKKNTLWIKTIHYPNTIKSHLETIASVAPFSPKSTSKLRSALHN